MELEQGLPAILSRYKELDRELADPEVASNPARLKELLKERGRLERPARLYEQWRALRRELHETEEMCRTESDPELRKLAEEETSSLESRIRETVASLADEMGSDEADRATSVIMEVRAGTGGDEAALFARDLLDMYRRFAELHRLKTEVLELSATELGGIREAVLSVSGPDVYRMLKFESGGHRVQRVPQTEAQGRIHTSAATVAVLPEVEEVAVDLKLEDLRIDTMRAGGPGGQKVNKTESAIRITHVPTGIVVKCQDEKSQHKNKARAMRILKGRLYERMREEKEKERAAARKSQIGSGDRSQRIRTYNFPQDRLSDHRLDFNFHDLPNVMLGRLDPLIDALRKKEKEERLSALDLEDPEETE